MLHRKNIVVFDFDGTLSKRDSNFEFGKYCLKHSLRPWLYLSVVLAAYVGRCFNPAGVWWREKMRSFITPKMIKKFSPDFIRKHKKLRFDWAKSVVANEHARGNMVVLISAGTDYLIPHLVSDMKFDAVICSKMDTEKPYKYKFLCWGANKVVALDTWAKENKIIPNIVRAYSDSKYDLPIMNIAREQVWVNRKTGIRHR